MEPTKIKVIIKELDPKILARATLDVIEALEEYDTPIKIGALHTLLVSVPIPYEIIEN